MFLCRAAKSITLTLLPRRRGNYKLSLRLRANTVPSLPKPAGMRSASGSSVIPGAATAAAGASGLVAVAASSPGTPMQASAENDAAGSAAYGGAMHDAGHSCIDSNAGEEAAGVANHSASSKFGWNASRPANEGKEAVVGGVPFLDGKPPLAVVAVTATANFPSLLVTDVFCQGLAKQVRHCGSLPVC